MPSADRRLGYRTTILAHMIRKKLCAERLPKASCVGCGFEGLDLVTDALVGPVACPFGLRLDAQLRHSPAHTS
jgi:hypothetical protein